MLGLEGIERRQAASIGAAIACVTAVGIGLSLTIPLLSLELDRMGVSRGMIGFNTAVAGAASLIVVPFVPRLAARFGLLPLLWVSVLTVPVVIVLFKVLFSVALWFPLRFILSAALGTLFVLSEYWITTAAPPDRRGLVMGIYATVLAAGLALGPLILALVGTAGFAPYLVGAGLFSLATLPLMVAGSLSPTIAESQRRSTLSFIFAAPAATLAAFAFGALETGGFSLLPVYGLAVGLDDTRGALLVSAIAVGNVIFQIPIGILADQMDRQRLLLIIGVLGALGACLIPLAASSFLALAALLFVWGGIIGAFYPVGLTYLGARFDGSDLAGANAAFVILYNVGLLLGPPAVGLSMDLDPPDGFAWSLAAFCALYAAVVGIRMAPGRKP